MDDNAFQWHKMTIISKYKALSGCKRKLIREASIVLVSSWFTVRFRAFKRYARDLGEPHSGEYSEEMHFPPDMIEKIRWAIETTSRPFGGGFTCLMKAMAGKVMLNRRGIRNTLTLGAKINLAKDQIEKTDMKAHAWLTVGTVILLGAEEKEGYIPVMSYTGP